MPKTETGSSKDNKAGLGGSEIHSFKESLPQGPEGRPLTKVLHVKKH